MKRWKTLPFQMTIMTSLLFVVLTAAAMLVFPGGSFADPQSNGYSFFRNFFSELGMTVTNGGHPNRVAAPLFKIALTAAGLGLVLFFFALPQFFRGQSVPFALSLAGMLAGLVSGISFVGVAFTPADLYLDWHTDFVLMAFRAFLVATLIYTVPMFTSHRLPSQSAWIFLGFAILLAGYIWLLTQGPDFDSPKGVIIQATGQKVIAYAAIGVALVQSIVVLRMEKRR